MSDHGSSYERPRTGAPLPVTDETKGATRSLPRVSEPAIAGILTRAEKSLAHAAESLLAEHLRQTLDEEGVAALIERASSGLLPLIQAVSMVLPRAVTEGTSPALLVAAHTLGATAFEQGLKRSELLSGGLNLHERLLHDIAIDLRTEDLVLITALLRVSRTLLEVEQAILLAYDEAAESRVSSSALHNARTGLAAWSLFTQRLSDAVLVWRRYKRPVALLLFMLDQSRSTSLSTLPSAAPEAFVSTLRDYKRGLDLAAQRDDGIFGIVLNETDQAGAFAFLERFSSRLEREAPTLSFHHGIAVLPDDGLASDVLLQNAERSLFQSWRSS